MAKLSRRRQLVAQLTDEKAALEAEVKRLEALVRKLRADAKTDK
jgi:cell division protein FtsB